MLIQGQFTVGVRVGACRGRVQEGAQGTCSPVPQGWRVKKGEEGQERTRDSGVCRGKHTMRFLGVPRDEGCIWFSMATTCWSRGHTELLDPFIPRPGTSGVDSALSLSASDGLSVSQSTHGGKPQEAQGESP